MRFNFCSTDSGWDNPFRPDGDLSREADEIVEMIKGGKPITPTTAIAVGSFDHADAAATAVGATKVAGSPVKANGASAPSAAPKANGGGGGDGALEVTHGRVAAADASQVEHVVLKKKPRCKCCVIQ